MSTVDLSAFSLTLSSDVRQLTQREYDVMDRKTRFKWLRRYVSKETEMRTRDITTEMMIAMTVDSKESDIERKYLIIRISEAFRMIRGFAFGSVYLLDDKRHVCLWNNYITHAITLQRMYNERANISVERLKEILNTFGQTLFNEHKLSTVQVIKEFYLCGWDTYLFSDVNWMEKVIAMLPESMAKYSISNWFFNVSEFPMTYDRVLPNQDYHTIDCRRQEAYSLLHGAMMIHWTTDIEERVRLTGELLLDIEYVRSEYVYQGSSDSDSDNESHSE